MDVDALLAWILTHFWTVAKFTSTMVHQYMKSENHCILAKTWSRLVIKPIFSNKLQCDKFARGLIKIILKVLNWIRQVKPEQNVFSCGGSFRSVLRKQYSVVHQKYASYILISTLCYYRLSFFVLICFVRGQEVVINNCLAINNWLAINNCFPVF
jgi:hypothetical protein